MYFVLCIKIKNIRSTKCKVFSYVLVDEVLYNEKKQIGVYDRACYDSYY